MSDIVLESIRSLILAGIIVYLLKAGRGRSELSHSGWQFIIAGFLLLFFGSTIDITDNFESLNRFIVVGDTPTQAFLEKLVGFLGGFLVLAIGLVRWIPTITTVAKVESLAKFPSENPNPVLRISIKDGAILYANAATKSILGEMRYEVGKKAPDPFLKKIEESVRTNQSAVFDIVSGSTIFSFVVAPVVDSGYANLYGRDVTQERKVEEMKSDFVSMASHQLKTPSAQIKGFADNMLSGLTGPLNEKQKEYLRDMLSIADRNSKLIDDLLNVSRLERGMVKADIKNVQIKEIIELALSAVKKFAKERDVTLKESYLAEDFYVMADFDKSVEVIRNIVHNAIKFTKTSSTVTISAYKDEEDVVVSVKDEGEGISAEEQKTLFLKEKVLGGRVKSSGAGLGLYLAKQFTELQGGKINFDTEPGKGTTFFIYFKQKNEKANS